MKELLDILCARMYHPLSDITEEQRITILTLLLDVPAEKREALLEDILSNG